MARAEDIAEVAPGIFLWQTYNPKVKAELYSTALETASGTFLVDPIALEPDALADLRQRIKAAAIFVTNVNHPRDAAQFAEIFSASILVHQELAGGPDFRAASGVRDRAAIAPGLTAIAVDGAPAGEMALHYDRAGGTIIIGDALINFEPHGFGLLPSKYCVDAKQMRRSLRKLLDYSFERMFFAHGTPILSAGRARLEQLLADNR